MLAILSSKKRIEESLSKFYVYLSSGLYIITFKYAKLI